MKKTTKGALAALAGGTLVFGGAGSLAYWTGDSTVDGNSIEAGLLDLSVPDCDGTPAGTTDWVFDDATPLDWTDNDPFDPDADTVVPGDTLTKICDMTLSLQGSHVTAALDVGSTNANWNASSSSVLTDELTAGVVFLADGVTYSTPLTTVGTGIETHTIRATITVSFPYGTEDNDSNSPLAGPALAAVLDDITVIATQQHDAA